MKWFSTILTVVYHI